MAKLKFIEEQELVEMFWKKYGYRQNIVRHQFESPIRKGGIDLFTVEIFDGRIYFVAFEFKLEDIKKAIAQAEENLKYAHKSFVVVPKEKVKTILDKYKDYLDKNRFIGVIGVETDGRWEICYKAMMQSDSYIQYNQEHFKLLLNIVS